MPGTATTLLIVLVMALLTLGVVRASRALFVKALREVVSLLRERGATSWATAATQEELGIVPRNPFTGPIGLRDYRPHALRLLEQADIVRTTNDGGLYLCEECLERSRVKELAGIE